MLGAQHIVRLKVLTAIFSTESPDRQRHGCTSFRLFQDASRLLKVGSGTLCSVRLQVPTDSVGMCIARCALRKKKAARRQLFSEELFRSESGYFSKEDIRSHGDFQCVHTSRELIYR